MHGDGEKVESDGSTFAVCYNAGTLVRASPVPPPSYIVPLEETGGGGARIRLRQNGRKLEQPAPAGL